MSLSFHPNGNWKLAPCHFKSFSGYILVGSTISSISGAVLAEVFNTPTLSKSKERFLALQLPSPSIFKITFSSSS